MKKTLFAISAIAVLLGFTACTSENETLEPQASKTITIKAYTESSDTRTALDVNEGSDDAGYPVLWTADDKIMIINDEITSNYAEFTLKSESANSSAGEFTGNALTEGTYTAYYPVDYDGTTWPTAQTYEANNIPLGVPMKATGINVDADGNVDPISFKNEGGILRLNLKLKEGDAARSVKKIVVSSTQLDEDIELNCETAVALSEAGIPFHIAVPAKAYTDLKFTIFDDGAYKCVRTLSTGNTLTVERSKITPVNLTAKSWEYLGLCFTAAEASTVSINFNGDQLEYSLNDGNWMEWANNSDISLASGDKVYLRLKTDGTWTDTSFTMSGSLAASGNIMTLVDRTGFSKEIPCDECFYRLFLSCTSLTAAPELPATTLTEKCYYQMFNGCTGLTTAPELPATTLAASCYYQMFYGCTGLTTAPELPATNLVKSCYYQMFYRCSNLNSVTCLATTYTNQNSVANWLTGVAKTGTFTKAKDATIWSSVSATNGIPNGWTVVDYVPTKGTAKATIGEESVDVNWVQLWKDGPKFAEFNLGAANNKPEDYGVYYKYDKTFVDFATSAWGDEWRTPTIEEWNDLMAKCSFEWTTENDVYGCKVTGLDKNNIFLPAAGRFASSASYQGEFCYYASSTMPDARNYNYFSFSHYGDPEVGTFSLTLRVPVRAVLKESAE